MPNAVTHVILTIILVDLFRDYYMKKRHKKYLTLHTIFIAGLAGLLPDIDIPINWFFGFVRYPVEFLRHGYFTHTAFFGLVFLLIGAMLWKKEKHVHACGFFVVSFGIIFHIFLDYLFGGGRFEGVMWLWPLSSEAFKVHLLDKLNLNNVPAALDAIILLGWLWHEEVKHKIRDYI